MVLNLENELEEEATELDPLFSSREALAQPYGENTRRQAFVCPKPTRVTVSGFSRYSNSVAFLPAIEQTRVKNVASMIVRSFRPSCPPITAVRLVGHADFDPSRERRDRGLMLRISRARAFAIRQALEWLIDDRSIASRIRWDVRGVGASQPVVWRAITEAGRRRNRRVDIWLNGEILEFEGPIAVPRPAPNAVDPEAAEPIFSGRVRTPEAPLLDPATLKLSSRWNQATHPKMSGITLAELRARLERYLARAALDDLVRRANAGTASLYGSDEATLVTLLAHQFQRKTCRKPTVGDITKPCTVDGRVAEDTLDALGFVYHAGARLNAADQVNTVAATTLGRVPASAFVGIEPGLTAKTWWSSMVSPPWLGLPIKQGIHLILLKRLRRAQHALMSLAAYANLSPAELGKALGLEEEHKGARPGVRDWSMHLFGLAIDIGFTRNPWVTNPSGNPSKVAEIALRAARLVGPSGTGERGITARYLHDLASANRDTDQIYKILADWSMWLGEYFALASDAKRLQSLLPVANVIYPADPAVPWLRPGESLAAAAARWTRLVRVDFDAFAASVSRTGSKKNEVRHGFMDLARDLVMALRDESCLGWGAVDFGPTASGDIMHFDCRIEGIGRIIAQTSGKPFVPETGHPCLAVAGTPAVQREFDQPQKSASTAPEWLRFTSNTIDSYTGIVEWVYTYSRYKGKPKFGPKRGRKTDYWVYLSGAALKADAIELLVFFHGDLGPACAHVFDPNTDWKTKNKKFHLDEQVEKTGRPVILIVPFIYWNGNNTLEVDGKWTAAKLNEFIEEALKNIEKKWKSRPTIKCLIIAGHSGAYRILNPLALEFNKNLKGAAKGQLAKLKEVWALDATYGTRSVGALETWAMTLPDTCKFTAVLNNDKSNWDCTEKGKIKPLDCWNRYYKTKKPPPNLKMLPVSDGHCEIPEQYIGKCLSAMPPC